MKKSYHGEKPPFPLVELPTLPVPAAGEGEGEARIEGHYFWLVTGASVSLPEFAG